jgi:hypothetical protein
MQYLIQVAYHYTNEQPPILSPQEHDDIVHKISDGDANISPMDYGGHHPIGLRTIRQNEWPNSIPHRDPRVKCCRGIPIEEVEDINMDIYLDPIMQVHKEQRDMFVSKEELTVSLVPPVDELKGNVEGLKGS